MRFRFIAVAYLLFSLFSVAKATTADEWIRVDSLPEVNVVSVKQSGLLQNQAISATTLNLGEIQLNDISDIKNISDLVPNFYMPLYGSRITSTIYVRGIGARMDQPSVGLNIDNMPVLNKDAYDLDIPDIYSVEMLRGPQSVLYGRNTMVGLINIRTISPLEWQGWRLMGEARSHSSFRLAGGWYHKFNNKTAFSVNIGMNSLYNGEKNLYDNSKIGTEKSGNIRLRFDWKPSSVLSIFNTLASSLISQSGYPYEYVPTGEINYNDTCFYHRFLLNDALTLKFDFNNWSLSSITTVQNLNDNMTLDQDFLPVPYFTLTQKKQETDLTEELMASRMGEHKYKWIFGVFGFYRHLDMQAPVTFKDTGIEKLIEYHRNEANPSKPIRWDSRDFLLDSEFRLPSFGLALYHESRYKAGNWDLSAGIRLDYEQVRMKYHSETHTSYTIYDNPSGILPAPFDKLEPVRVAQINIDDKGDISTHFLTLLPKISALYNLPSSLGNVYFTFGKGYKAGGFNTQMFSDVLQQKLMSIMGIGSQYKLEDIVKYKPEWSWNYEIGSHLDFSKLSSSQLANLTCDISLFYIDCRDQQLTVFPSGNTTGRMMTNAGKTRSFGGELSIYWNPWSTLSFNFGVGYTNAKFVKYNNGKEDFAGKYVPYAPSSTLFLQGIYTLQTKWLRSNALVFDLNVRGTGRIYWNESNSLHQNLYFLPGVSITFKAPKWELQAWCKNITNTRYSTFYFVSISNEFLQRGNPRSFGATIRLNF